MSSRYYSIRATSTNPLLRLGFPVTLCCASDHDTHHICQGIKPDPAKIKAINSMPPPINVGQVHMFLDVVA
ncbi:hypothetical protein DSO57_1030338 [Entomophthora muscae]|uniref:Uncharacterized protein n=1 Tax=Entomophthora muscae TaxID=34485 RepID=A0ACC2S306_9FUNG|nr:hypothetical protein DSO57_1030338 [Entomophthora muscae]